MKHFKRFIKTLFAENPRINSFFRVMLNLFFRGNNLAIAYFKAFLHQNRIEISSKSDLFNCKITMLGGGNSLIIGESCILRSLSVYMNDSYNSVQMGMGVIVNANKDNPTRFNACNGTKIIIGDNCMFSNNIELHTTDYHPIFNLNEERINDAKSIDIGKNSWIGLRATILKGVCIAPNTIVGACSVLVKSNTKENVVLAGNPAKEVKSGCVWRLS